MKLLPYRILVQLLYPCNAYVRVVSATERSVYIPDLARGLKTRTKFVRKALKHLLQAALIEGLEEDRDTWTATIRLKETAK